jgi:octopine/nopaline transport system permease protein
MTWIDYIGFGPQGRGELLLYGALMTLAVTLASMVVGAIFGSLVAWGKLSKSLWARGFGDVYTTVFRGIPELLIIYLVYFGGQNVVSAVGAWMGFDSASLALPAFLAGSLAVGVISGSYQAEVYRGAYLAILPGEIDAARSIGMSKAMRFRRIIVPQVMRFALPGLGNVWQLSLKDSALISVTGLAEILRVAQTSGGSTREYTLFYVAGGCLYLILTTLTDRVFGAGEKHIAKSFRSSIGRG